MYVDLDAGIASQQKTYSFLLLILPFASSDAVLRSLAENDCFPNFQLNCRRMAWLSHLRSRLKFWLA